MQRRGCVIVIFFTQSIMMAYSDVQFKQCAVMEINLITFAMYDVSVRIPGFYGSHKSEPYKTLKRFLALRATYTNPTSVANLGDRTTARRHRRPGQSPSRSTDLQLVSDWT